MTTARTRAYRPTRWEIERLREGKQYRDAHPASSPAEQAENDALDEWLATAEAAYRNGANVETGQDVGEIQSYAQYKANDGARSYRADPATEAQLRYIAKLARDLGRELETPRDKKHASLIIDKAKAELAQPRRWEGGRPVRDTPAPQRMATERQLGYLRDLLRDRDWAGDEEITTVNELQDDEISFAAATAAIDRLRMHPRRPRGAAPEHGIREGRYAYTADGGATADHYRVTRDGKILIWSAGGEYPYTGKGLNEALTWIKANPREAAVLFGRLTESCGRCGRDLSDDDSRKRGLGPVCANKTEW